MLKLGVALANKEIASLITKHLTKDKLFDITDISTDSNSLLDSNLEHCDLMLIDNNLIFNKELVSPRGICPLNKPSCLDDFKNRLYQLGFSYSQGTDYLAEIIYDLSTNNSEKFVLKKYYEKIAKKYSTQPDKVKWSVINSFRNYKAHYDLPKNVNNFREFIWWIIKN